jgi:RNA polymerase sigma-70 factor (family 1)
LNNFVSYTDDELVAMLKLSNQQAFNVIFERYWKTSLYKAAKKLNQLETAEEIVQDVFIDLWNRRESLEIKSLNAYIQAAVKYRVINARVKANRYNSLIATSIKQDNLQTEHPLEFDELKDRLETLVNGLPQHCRLVYQLHREEGFSHKEIAQKLVISEKTVQYHLSKALRNLRAGLSHLFSIFF